MKFYEMILYFSNNNNSRFKIIIQLDSSSRRGYTTTNVDVWARKFKKVKFPYQPTTKFEPREFFLCLSSLNFELFILYIYYFRRYLYVCVKIYNCKIKNVILRFFSFCFLFNSYRRNKFNSFR